MPAPSARQPLSVAIIAKDEADRIGAALASVAFAADRVVVESGSADGTARAAAAAGARVVCADWPGHAAQKQRATALAEHDWVLGLDADEEVDAELAEALRAGSWEGKGFSAYRVRRRTWWEGAEIRHGLWGNDRPVRLFDRRRARWVGPDPHDRLVVDGPVGELPGALIHRPFRSLEEHLQTIARYSEIGAAAALQRGARAGAGDLLVRPVAHLLKALVLRGGWRDGARGLALAGLGAAAVLLKWTLIRTGAGRAGGPR
jgi:glycosyltransferase involved in cell wall biosynthesis